MQKQTSTHTDKTIVDKTKRKSASSKLIGEGRKLSANGNFEPLKYEAERLQTYAENHVNARFVLPLFILCLALVMGKWVGTILALYWALFAFLSYGAIYLFCRRFLRSSHEELNLRKWRSTFLVGQVLVAMAWVGFSFYSCMSCDLENNFMVVQFSAILVLQALTMILSYGFGSSLLITSAPATLVLATRMFISTSPLGWIMATILVASQVFFYFIANRISLSMLAGLAHRSEREDLISELETAKAISEEARRRAEEANLAKSRFLATMSHELRTPLNAILGFSEVMQNEVLGPMENPTYKDYVKDIHSSGAHLLNVINEILDLSRIEAGRHDLNEEAIKLAHVVEDAAHMVQLKAKNKNVVIQLQLEESMPMIWADEKAVRQVTLNLLSNALKFTPTGGNIKICCGWTSKGGQYLSIKDNGPGIPEEEIPIVLSSFGQGSIAIKSAEQGSGLGLPIVQALMHMHDGKFELKSKLRAGTEVIATFPRSRVLEFMEKTENTGQTRRNGSERTLKRAFS